MEKKIIKLELPEFTEDELKLLSSMEEDELTFTLKPEISNPKGLDKDFKSKLYKKTISQKIFENWHYGAIAASLLIAFVFTGYFQKDLIGSSSANLAHSKINDLTNTEPSRKLNHQKLNLLNLSMETDLVDLLSADKIPSYEENIPNPDKYSIKKSNIVFRHTKSVNPFNVQGITNLGIVQAEPCSPVKVDAQTLQSNAKKEFSNAISLLKNKNACINSTTKIVDNKSKLSERNFLPAKQISEAEALQGKYFIESEESQKNESVPVFQKGTVIQVEQK